MTGSIIADAPTWAQGLFVLAWGACMVAVLHIIREAWYRPDPYSHDITPILVHMRAGVCPSRMTVDVPQLAGVSKDHDAPRTSSNPHN